MELNPKVRYKQVAVDAWVVRCTCKTDTARSAHAGRPCPRGQRVALGTIDYYHRNPLHRLIWRVKRAFRRRCEHWV